MTSFGQRWTAWWNKPAGKRMHVIPAYILIGVGLTAGVYVNRSQNEQRTRDLADAQVQTCQERIARAQLVIDKFESTFILIEQIAPETKPIVEQLRAANRSDAPSTACPNPLHDDPGDTTPTTP